MAEPGLSGQADEWWIEARCQDTDHIRIISVAGEIDNLTARTFQEAVDDGFAGAAGRSIVIDLTAVTFLGSAGLAVLAQAASRIGPGHQLRVVADSHAVVCPITMTGLDRILALCHSVGEATAIAG